MIKNIKYKKNIGFYYLLIENIEIRTWDINVRIKYNTIIPTCKITTLNCKSYRLNTEAFRIESIASNFTPINDGGSPFSSSRIL